MKYRKILRVKKWTKSANLILHFNHVNIFLFAYVRKNDYLCTQKI